MIFNMFVDVKIVKYANKFIYPDKNYALSLCLEIDKSLQELKSYIQHAMMLNLY